MKIHYKEVTSSLLNIKVDKRTECFNWGDDNAFPSLVEVLISGSVTAKTCVDRVAKAIYGKSFGDKGKVIVNSKGQSLNEVLRIAAREYAKHNNVFIHITYDANFDIKAVNIISCTESRIGKADDKGYSGKIIIYDNWDKSKKTRIESNNFEVCDKYNPDKKIIEGQVIKAGELTDYNGQIIHIRKDETFVYSKTDLFPALSEALLEANSQTFRSRGASKGFLNTKLLTVQPFKDNDQRKEFKKDLNEVRGAENSSEVILLETSQMVDDLSKQIKIDDLSGTYNDKLFEYSDKQAEKNICKAFTVPLMLVSQTDNSLFGSSGEMLKEAKLQLWETREEDRDQFEEVFGNIMKRFQAPKKIESSLKIINPYVAIQESEETPIDLNQEAQATLRGSVGGVTALLAIQQSVALGTTTESAGIAIIVNIFGIDETTAKAMLGKPDAITTTVKNI